MRRMKKGGELASAAPPFAGQTLYLVGRAEGLTRRRLERLIAAQGGKLAARLNARVTVAAVGHSAVSRVLPDGQMQFPAGLPDTAELISEFELRRRLGLRSAPALADRDLGAGDLERLAKLTRAQVASLVLFDVVESVDGRFGYRDLVAAREAGRLLARNVTLSRIIETAIALARRGNSLADTKLAEAPSGGLVRELSGQLAELSGQLTMALGASATSIDDLIASAETAEAEGNFAAAEKLYATALRAEPHDPVIAFNLGNVFDAQNRPAEAKIAWQIAVARDPGFAEAWYNLALAAEDSGHEELSIAQYRRALQADPDYSDAAFNLALLLTRLERSREALALWERLLEASPSGAQAATARKAAALCRMHLKQLQSKAG